MWHSLAHVALIRGQPFRGFLDVLQAVQQLLGIKFIEGVHLARIDSSCCMLVVVTSGMVVVVAVKLEV